MVKKIYIQPNMVVKNVATQSIIALSDPTASIDFDESAAPEDFEVKDSRGGFFSDEW